MAGTSVGDRGLIAAARPYLQDLAERVGETAGVSIQIGRSVYYLDQVTPNSEVQVRSWIGEYIPMHLVPSGLVHLAHAGRAQVDDYVAGGLDATTRHSVADLDALSVQLDRIRSSGYAWVFEGFAYGINSAAAPVLRPDRTVIAALHIHGPAYRFPDPNRTHDIGLLLKDSGIQLG